MLTATVPVAWSAHQTLATISDSYATGDVYSGDSGGGLVGSDSSDTISRTYASGNVDGDADLGGLIGNANSDLISDSFAVGDR